MVDRIKITGLKEFQKALRDMDSALPKQIRLVLNDASNLVIDWAGARMPTRTGRAKSSLKAASSQRDARVSLGGRRAPYAPWLDFGGQGRIPGRPAPRAFIKHGRYVYAALDAQREEITAVMERGLTQLAESNGLDVT